MTQVRQSYQERLRVLLHEVSLYPVACERLAAGRDDRQWLDAVLAGGARIVQLRDKDSPDRVLYEKALYFRAKTREAGALFLVNDRVDIALMSDADGVHLGQQDLPAAAVRRLAPEMLIGVSCNSLVEAEELGRLAAAPACPVSYFNIGPLFPTATKDGLSSFLGLTAIELFSSRCPLPFTVMGGIKLEHVPALVTAGAQRIAVVTAISQAADMRDATARWIAAIGQQTKKGREDSPRNREGS
ncbi:MAG: thiamine-phosphate diphosphorylase [Desulfobulbaceae bacterium A2]|nr:MAG: thiamine-phosphate diphosphorylase [Desulfobulbaceae bacterium A2]